MIASSMSGLGSPTSVGPLETRLLLGRGWEGRRGAVRIIEAGKEEEEVFRNIWRLTNYKVEPFKH